jgi:hypothetical protein
MFGHHQCLVQYQYLQSTMHRIFRADLQCLVRKRESCLICSALDTLVLITQYADGHRNLKSYPNKLCSNCYLFHSTMYVQYFIKHSSRTNLYPACAASCINKTTFSNCSEPLAPSCVCPSLMPDGREGFKITSSVSKCVVDQCDDTSAAASILQLFVKDCGLLVSSRYALATHTKVTFDTIPIVAGGCGRLSLE